jgi:diguanylate cyclase (GGDEF)-like protein
MGNTSSTRDSEVADGFPALTGRTVRTGRSTRLAALPRGERGPPIGDSRQRMLDVSGAAAERAAPGAPRVAMLCGIGSALTGAVVIVAGWAFGLRAVREVVPGTVGMKASTALMFVLVGAGLLLAPHGGARRRIGWICAAACVLIALAFLSEYLTGWALGIDELPFRDAAGRATDLPYPGRPAPATALCFLLVGASLLALHSRWRVAEALLVPVLAVAAMCLVGYAYSIPAFYGPVSAAKMALNTGAVLLVVAAGIMCAQPNGRVHRILASKDPGDEMARRLLPLAVLVPLMLGWLRIMGQNAGLFGLRVGTWILTMTTIVCLMGVVGWSGASLSRTDAQRRRLERELHRLAGEDELTHLANRRGFVERLRHELALAARHDTPGALLMIDLDHFKAINDEHGHATGDALLRGVGDALTQRLRDTDALGRIGGDEFVAYLPHTDVSGATYVARQLLGLIHEASVALGHGIDTTASIGVGLDPGSSVSHEAILKAADGAMYRAKRAGGNRVMVSEQPTHPHEARTSGEMLTALS